MIEGTEGGGAVAADVADVAVDEEDDEEVDEGYDVEDGGTGKYCSRRISRSPITMSNVRICIKKKKKKKANNGYVLADVEESQGRA